MLYHYRVDRVAKVYDGDTITVDLDLGFNHVMRDQKIRLWGIDAPEVRGHERPDGIKSRDALAEMLEGRPVILKTIKDRTGRYGRWLAVVFVETPEGGWVNANEYLVGAGLAELNTYGDRFDGWPTL